MAWPAHCGRSASVRSMASSSASWPCAGSRNRATDSTPCSQSTVTCSRPAQQRPRPWNRRRVSCGAGSRAASRCCSRVWIGEVIMGRKLAKAAFYPLRALRALSPASQLPQVLRKLRDHCSTCRSNCLVLPVLASSLASQAPIGTAHGLSPMRSRWEQLSCTACTGLIAGKPGPYRYRAWLEPDAVEVGATVLYCLYWPHRWQARPL
ncbi:hypothetical protein D3C72_963500 [compost metagenome]